MVAITWKITIFSAVAVLQLACNRTEGSAVQKENSAAGVGVNEAKADLKVLTGELLEITAPGYETTGFAEQECLGRLVFEVESGVQWPTYFRGDIGNEFVRSFSEQVYNNSDVIKFGEYRIAVIAAPDAEAEKAIKWELPSVARVEYANHISNAEKSLKEMKATKTASQHDIDSLLDSIKGWQRALTILNSENFDFNPNIPNAQGFGKAIADGASSVENFSVYRVYITYKKYVYIFESSKRITTKDYRKLHEQEFVAQLKKFVPREANEIPSGPGVCIPYGFLRDDGTTPSDMKLSFRMPDAQGVLYTIHTGSRGNRRSSPTLKAISFASVGKMGTPEDVEVAPFITDRIGPRSYKIGGVEGKQGGVAARIGAANSGYETYQVFTGYSGSAATEALPFIFVELNTTTMEMAPELKQNPPPFKQSMERYESLLRSIRLRPTTPPMPESSSARGQPASK